LKAFRDGYPSAAFAFERARILSAISKLASVIAVEALGGDIGPYIGFALYEVGTGQRRGVRNVVRPPEMAAEDGEDVTISTRSAVTKP